MTGPTIGTCEKCGEIASIQRHNGDWLCPNCRFQLNHPDEPPLY